MSTESGEEAEVKSGVQTTSSAEESPGDQVVESPGDQVVESQEAEVAESPEEEVVESAQGRETPGAGSSEDREITAELAETLMAALGERLDELDRKFENRLLSDQHKDTLIDRLHAELQTHKDGLLRELLKPILTDLVRLHDDLSRMLDDLAKRPDLDMERVLRSLSSFPDDILDILERQGVETFEAEAGSVFDPKTQKVIERVPIEDSDADKKVVQTVRPGFQWDERVFRRQMVNVGAFQEAVPDSKSEMASPDQSATAAQPTAPVQQESVDDTAKAPTVAATQTASPADPVQDTPTES